MRIAYLVSRYPTFSHTFIRREIAALRHRGLQIDTFSLRRPAPEELVTEGDRQEAARTTYILPAGPLRTLIDHILGLALRPRAYVATFRAALDHRIPGPRAALWALFHFAEAIVLVRELRRRGTPHLHGHFSNAAGDVGYLATTYLGIGWSLTLHGSADFDSPTSSLLGVKLAATRFTACVSRHGLALARRASGPEVWPRLIVARCGIDLADVPRRAVDSRHQPLRILCVGRLAPEKGHVGLIDAFAEVRARGIDAELTIIGDGPERARIAARIAQHGVGACCQLPGLVSEQEVWRALTRADLFVLSSLSEGLPVVLLEALAVGVPVIAPRLAGIPELVEDGQTGLLYSPAAWDELAELTVRLLRDPQLGRRLAAEGRQRVEEEFEINRAVEPLWERFQSCALAPDATG